MKPTPFEYHSPVELQAALELKQRYGYDALALAGGQSLVAALNFRCLTPRALIDLNNIPELAYVRIDRDNDLLVGPMTRTRQLEFNAIIEKSVPLIHAAVPYIAHPAIRNRGTIGGSISYADPAAEFPAVTIAMGAQFKLAGARGERWVAAEDFFTGMFKNCLTEDELLAEIKIPVIKTGQRWGYKEISRRQGDRVMMGAAAYANMDEMGICRSARLVYLNAAQIPFLAIETAKLLVGEKWSPGLTEAVAVKASQEIEPEGDVHATSAYQRHLAEELTRRVLKQVFQVGGGAL